MFESDILAALAIQLTALQCIGGVWAAYAAIQIVFAVSGAVSMGLLATLLRERWRPLLFFVAACLPSLFGRFFLLHKELGDAYIILNLVSPLGVIAYFILDGTRRFKQLKRSPMDDWYASLPDLQSSLISKHPRIRNKLDEMAKRTLTNLSGRTIPESLEEVAKAAYRDVLNLAKNHGRADKPDIDRQLWKGLKKIPDDIHQFTSQVPILSDKPISVLWGHYKSFDEFIRQWDRALDLLNPFNLLVKREKEEKDLKNVAFFQWVLGGVYRCLSYRLAEIYLHPRVFDNETQHFEPVDTALRTPLDVVFRSALLASVMSLAIHCVVGMLFIWAVYGGTIVAGVALCFLAGLLSLNQLISLKTWTSLIPKLNEAQPTLPATASLEYEDYQVWREDLKNIEVDQRKEAKDQLKSYVVVVFELVSREAANQGVDPSEGGRVELDTPKNDHRRFCFSASAAAGVLAGVLVDVQTVLQDQPGFRGWLKNKAQSKVREGLEQRIMGVQDKTSRMQEKIKEALDWAYGDDIVMRGRSLVDKHLLELYFGLSHGQDQPAVEPVDPLVDQHLSSLNDDDAQIPAPVDVGQERLSPRAQRLIDMRHAQDDDDASDA